MWQAEFTYFAGGNEKGYEKFSNLLGCFIHMYVSFSFLPALLIYN